jgi:hypothetical protein
LVAAVAASPELEPVPAQFQKGEQPEAPAAVKEAASPELEPVPEQPPLVESEAPVAVKEVESPELEPVPEQFQKEEQPEAVPH